MAGTLGGESDIPIIGGHSKILSTLFALTLTWPAVGAISLCSNGQLSAVAQHGAAQAYFYLPLDPSLNAATTTSITVTGREVLIEVVLGPDSGSPLPNPNCFFVTASLPGSLEPGDYNVRWVVRRVINCSSGTCEAENATFSQVITVAEPLVCSGAGPVFDLLPYPPLSGTNIKALHASSNVTPFVLSAPVVTIADKSIHISQIGTYSGPPPPPTIYCLSTSANLGVLAAGRYDVTWELATSAGVETYRDSFEVLNAAAIPTLRWPVLLGLIVTLAILSFRALPR